MSRSISPVATWRTGLAGRRAMQVGPLAGQVRPREVTVAITALIALAIVVCVNLGRGSYPMDPFEVAHTFFGRGSSADRLIMLELRLPRSLTGILVGAALGLAGAITQTLASNPLASPELLGVTAGAGTAVVAVVVVGGTYGAVSGWLAAIGVPVAALGGGLVAGLAVYLLAWREGVDAHRLVLVGIGVTTLLTSVMYWLLTVGEVTNAGRALVWITGSLNARGWEHVIPVGLSLVVLFPIALGAGGTLDVLHHGDEVARSLGVRVECARGLLLLVAVALASVATAAAGPVLFVALATPQIALRLAGVSRPPLLLSAVIGALLTVSADLTARTAFGGAELPVGIVTACLGGSYLLFLLVRGNRRFQG